MTIDIHRSLRPAPSVFARTFDGEVVLLDLAKGEYFGLDEVGSRIWDAVVRGAVPADIAQEIAAVYEVDAARVLADTLRLVGELESRGLIVVDE